jgi:hypothetical protein
VLSGTDQDADGSRSDVYRFHGRAGEGLHAAVDVTNADHVELQIIDRSTSRALEQDPEVAGPDAPTVGPPTMSWLDFSLPRDGDYDLVVRASRADMTADSPALRYTLGMAHERGVSYHLDAVSRPPDLGLGFHFSFGLGYASVTLNDGSHSCFSPGAEAGPDYQFTEKVGVDLLAEVNLFVGGEPVAGFAMLFGPRVRYGNKHHGFVALAAGRSLLIVPTDLPPEIMEPQLSGFGMRADVALAPGRAKNPKSKVTLRLYAEMLWHGESSFFAAGFATSL